MHSNPSVGKIGSYNDMTVAIGAVTVKPACCHRKSLLRACAAAAAASASSRGVVHNPCWHDNCGTSRTAQITTTLPCLSAATCASTTASPSTMSCTASHLASAFHCSATPPQLPPSPKRTHTQAGGLPSATLPHVLQHTALLHPAAPGGADS